MVRPISTQPSPIAAQPTITSAIGRAVPSASAPTAADASDAIVNCTAPSSAEASPARSCWSEPNCIEADFTASEVAYREVGEVAPTGSALYLSGPRVVAVEMMVKLMRDAAPGVEPYDPDDGNVFVVARHGDGSCTLVADIELTRVDVSPGGVTEGRFAGELFACDALGEIRNGRFRRTAPP